MNRFLLPGSLLLLLAACTSRPATEQQGTAPTDSARVATAAPGTLPATPTALPARLQNLGLQPNHDWRAVSLGDAFAAAKATETATPFEQDSTHVGYTQELDNLESVDYQYIQQNGVVATIEVDLYLNTAGSVEAYRQDLTTYLTARYGPGTRTELVTSWQNGKAVLRNVSKRKDFGLKLTLKR